MAGPAAWSLARLVRERWKFASDIEPLPLRDADEASSPHTWPDSDPPDFENIDVSIARTVPAMKDSPAIREIEQVYLDEIARAENFIYIRTSFFALTRIRPGHQPPTSDKTRFACSRYQLLEATGHHGA